MTKKPTTPYSSYFDLLPTGREPGPPVRRSIVPLPEEVGQAAEEPNEVGRERSWHAKNDASVSGSFSESESDPRANETGATPAERLPAHALRDDELEAPEDELSGSGDLSSLFASAKPASSRGAPATPPASMRSSAAPPPPPSRRGASSRRHLPPAAAPPIHRSSNPATKGPAAVPTAENSSAAIQDLSPTMAVDPASAPDPASSPITLASNRVPLAEPKHAAKSRTSVLPPISSPSSSSNPSLRAPSAAPQALFRAAKAEAKKPSYTENDIPDPFAMPREDGVITSAPPRQWPEARAQHRASPYSSRSREAASVTPRSRASVPLQPIPQRNNDGSSSGQSGGYQAFVDDEITAVRGSDSSRSPAQQLRASAEPAVRFPRDPAVPAQLRASDSMGPAAFSLLPPANSRWRRNAWVVGSGCVAMLAAFIFSSGSSTGRLEIGVTGPAGTPVSDVKIFLDDELRCEDSPCVMDELEARSHLVRIEAEGYEKLAPLALLVKEDTNTVHNSQLSIRVPTEAPVVSPSKAEKEEQRAGAAHEEPMEVATLEPEKNPGRSGNEPSPEPARRAAPEPAERVAPQSAAGPSTRASDPQNEATGNGTLNLNSIPVSTVIVDGRPLGKTPRIGVSVTPGTHSIVFVHPEMGRKRASAAVDPGSTKTISVEF